MKYLAAYALLTLAGNKNISGNDVKQLLGSAQVNISDDDLNRLVESLKGKDVNKLIAEGSAKIGAVGAPAPSTGSKPAVQQKAKQQPKKSAPKAKEPVKEDSDDDMMAGGLFD